MKAHITLCDIEAMDQISQTEDGIFADDCAVIKQIEKIFPQRSVRFFVERLSYDHFYDNAFLPYIDQLTEKFKEIGFNTREPVTGKALDDFKGKFEDLIGFLADSLGEDKLVKGRFSIHPKTKERPEEYAQIIKDMKTKASAFEKAYKTLLETAMDKLHPSNISSVKNPERLRIVMKDIHGNFFMDGNRIEMSKNTLYYNAFDIVISQVDQNGEITYDHIQKELEKRILSGDVETTSEDINTKTIQNALGSEQLFKLAKINGQKLVNKLPNGQKIIKSNHGKGYSINNPFL